MAVSMLSNVGYRGRLPDNVRSQFDTIEAMASYNENHLPDMYDAFCLEDGKEYRYKRTNSVDPKTGRWRVNNEGGISEIPTASATEKGGVKIGDGLSMDGEVLKADEQTEENFTTELKEKLEGIDMDTKVDVEEGKGLSTNDLTDELKAKYDKAEENVQSDWGQTDETADDFIKGKPVNLSDFENDEEFIKNTVDNLTNYYKKTETYTQSEINALVNAINSFEIKKVAELPTEDINPHCIYFIPKEDIEGNIFNEFIYIDDKWENLGPSVLPKVCRVDEIVYENPSHADLDNVEKALDYVIEKADSVPSPSAADKVLLSAIENEKPVWTQVDKDEVGGDSSVELTQAEYDELERRGEIKEDITYYITDLNSGEDKDFVKVIKLSSTEYELLSEEEKNDSTKLFAITDAESESFSQTKILAGKKCICFGDSITWYDGNAYNWGKEEGVIAKGYETYLRTSLGLNVTNAGMSGYTMPGIYETIKNYNFINYDYLTITGGCNDERHNTPVGTVSPIGSTFDTSTYIGALQAFIEKAIYQNPEIKIILITPIKGWIYPQDGWAYEGHPTDLVYETSEKYANAIKEVAKVYSLPVCDWFNTSGINLCTRNIYINDPEPPENTFYSLHPSTKGYKRMAEQLIPYFKNSVI